MQTAFCRGCGQSIHPNAQTCPSCGAVQNPTLSVQTPAAPTVPVYAAQTPVSPAIPSEKKEPIWAAITSLVFAVLGFLGLLSYAIGSMSDDGYPLLERFSDVITNYICVFLALVFSTVSFAITKSHRKFLIASLAVCSVTFVISCILLIDVFDTLLYFALS